MYIKDITKIVSEFDVISFDIFDTLLLRPLVDPQDVWRIMENNEGAVGFAKARRKADAITYRKAIKQGCETTIDEAYALISKWAGMKDRELECERRLLVANPDILELWNTAGKLGKKRVIVSDMYLPGGFIKSVLRENGIDGWDGFFLSSERRVRKSSGRLFSVMLNEMGVSPDKVLHIGDNRRSDVVTPSKLGLTAIEYVAIRERFEEANPFVKIFRKENPSLDKNMLVGALTVGWHKYILDNPDYTYWNRIGYLFGGVLGYMYINWVVQTSRKMGFNHLMFVGRDGYVWQKICNAIAPDMRADYFYAPRTISVRVQGVIGNDVNALKDRQEYIDENLQGVDSARELANYREYLKKFKIDSHRTALIDGCSSGFSAQRLVERAIGAPIFSFYILAMAPLTNGEALYKSHMRSIEFQNFSEFIFSSPEPPVKTVDVGGPAFIDEESVFEKLKISCAPDIAKGAVACAKILNQFDVQITPQLWMEFFEYFVWRLTAVDLQNLAVAKNSTDISHKKYTSVIDTALLPERSLVLLGSYRILSIKYRWQNGTLLRTLYLCGRLPLISKRSFFYKHAF